MICKWPLIYIDSENSISISRYKTNYGMNVHQHEKYFEIEYVISGVCHQNIKNELYESFRGDIALLQVGSSHEIFTSDELEILKIMIKPEYLPEIYIQHAHEFDPAVIIHLPPNEVVRVEQILFMIENELRMKKEFFLDVISGYLNVLFALLIRVNRIIEENKRTLPSFNLNLILSYIEENLKTVTPRSIAFYTGYDSSYFSKIFKRNMNINLSEYINLRKIEKAKKLLLENSEVIDSIVYEVGFNHKSYFYRIFKRYCGVTPDEYRKSGAI